MLDSVVPVVPVMTSPNIRPYVGTLCRQVTLRTRHERRTRKRQLKIAFSNSTRRVGHWDGNHACPCCHGLIQISWSSSRQVYAISTGIPSTLLILAFTSPLNFGLSIAFHSISVSLTIWQKFRSLRPLWRRQGVPTMYRPARCPPS